MPVSLGGILTFVGFSALALLSSCDLQNAGTAHVDDAGPSDVTLLDQGVDAPIPDDGGTDATPDVQPEAGGPTSPGELPARLQAWYRSDIVDLVDGGNQVATWPDKSSSGDVNRIAVAKAQNAPTVVTDAGYPMPVLRFPQDTYLQTKAWTGPPIAPPITVFVVGDGRGYFTDSLNQNTQVAVLGFNNASDLRMFAGSYVTNGGTPVGKRAVVALFDGANSEIHNSSNPATAKGNAGPNQLTGLTIGAYAGLIGGFALDGNLAEVAVWDRRLTPKEIESLNAYAAARYGLTIIP